MSSFIDDLFKKIERRMREIEDLLRREVEDLFRGSGLERLRSEQGYFGESIEPLYTIRDLGDRVVVYIDMPYASEGSIEVKFQGNRMLVYAKLRSSVNPSEWAKAYRGVEVKEYRSIITLPFEPRPEGTRVRVKKGVVEVSILKPWGHST